MAPDTPNFWINKALDEHLFSILGYKGHFQHERRLVLEVIDFSLEFSKTTPKIKNIGQTSYSWLFLNIYKLHTIKLNSYEISYVSSQPLILAYTLKSLYSIYAPKKISYGHKFLGQCNPKLQRNLFE